jgi:hypothetical protein
MWRFVTAHPSGARAHPYHRSRGYSRFRRDVVLREEFSEERGELGFGPLSVAQFRTPRSGTRRPGAACDTDGRPIVIARFRDDTVRYCVKTPTAVGPVTGSPSARACWHSTTQPIPRVWFG